jgi:hypothetical protein
MTNKDLISLTRLCSLYEIEVSFVSHLEELGLLELTAIEEDFFIHRDRVEEAERMIRLHRDLQVNPEGIDVIFNLLHKVDRLHHELNDLRNRLRLYEKE